MFARSSCTTLFTICIAMFAAIPPDAAAQEPAAPEPPPPTKWRRSSATPPNVRSSYGQLRAYPSGATTVEPAVLEKGTYLGVASSPASAVLRKQLKLPDGIGLVVDYVEP